MRVTAPGWACVERAGAVTQMWELPIPGGSAHASCSAFQSRLIFLASDHLWTSVGPS